MKTYSYEQVRNSLEALLCSKGDFSVTGLRGNFNEAIKLIETAIEAKGMTCRVETDIKGALVGAGAAGVAIGVVGGISSIGAGILFGAGKLAHSLVTYNPDFEIRKDYINKKLTVVYKKK